LFTANVLAQTPESYYSDAYSKIASMLEGKDALDFKKAVLTVENAYFENQLNEEVFENVLGAYVSFCKGVIASGNVIYAETDTERATAQCAVFTFMTDFVPFVLGDSVVKHTPFEYNFDDFAGQKEWSNMFVSTLMV
jgi:hypothetical protein